MRNVKLLLLTFGCVVFLGCAYHEKSREYGVFTYTAYYRKNAFDFHSGAGIYEEKLCSKNSTFCVRAKNIDFELPDFGKTPWTVPSGQPWLIVWKQEPEVASKIRFFNAMTGEEIYCTNCNTEAERRLDRYGYILQDYYWMHGAKRMLIQSGPAPEDHSKINLDYLEFNGDHVEFLPITDYVMYTNPKQLVFHPRLDKMDFISWMICDVQCTAHTFDFQTRVLRANVAVCEKGQTIWEENRKVRCVSITEFRKLDDAKMATKATQKK